MKSGHAGEVTYALRYYSPSYDRAAHLSILELLREIGDKWRIAGEIVEIGFRMSEYGDNLIADEGQEEEIYKRDFLSRKDVLKVRTGQAIARNFRSRSGGYFVAGTVAVVANSQVQWIAHHGAGFGGQGEDPHVAFMKALYGQGPDLLRALCAPFPRAAPEQRLIERFLTADVLKGVVKQEVRIGNHRKLVDAAAFDWRKAIDIVVERPTEVWIIEAKVRLNYEAIGEVLTYRDLYTRRSIPSERSRWE